MTQSRPQTASSFFRTLPIAILCLIGLAASFSAPLGAQVNPVCVPTQNVALDGSGNASITAAMVDGGSTADPGWTIYATIASPTSFNCSNVGPNSVTLTVFAFQNAMPLITASASCVANVTVQDLIPPTAVGQSITVNLDGTGNATILASALDNGSTDNCPAGLTYSATQTAFTCANIGANTVTLTVTDASSNSDTDVVTVTVVDMIPPVVSGCPGTITVNTGGACNAVATWTAPTATDNCVTVFTSSTHSSGATFPVGTTMVTYTFTDGTGNSSTCNFNVVVNDNTPPTFTGCPTSFSQSTDPGLCTAVVTWIPPVENDNCGATVVASHTPGSIFPLGMTTVTYTATDAAMNSAVCSFDVTVTDNQPPTINCPSNITTSATSGACSAVVTYSVTASDNCTGVGTPSLTSGLASGSAFPVGTSTVNYTVSDANGNSSNCSFTVTVTDNENPTFTSCPSNISVNNDLGVCGAIVVYATPTATDNCALLGTPSLSTGQLSGTLFPVGVTTVTWVATDVNGNSSNCVFTVTVTDTEDPQINDCLDDFSVNADALQCSAVVNYLQPTATDNCGAVTLTNIVGPGSGGTFPVGVTTVVWQAIDTAGNISLCTFDVTVVDTQAPAITCPSNIAVNTDTGTCTAIVNFVAPVGTDNCAGPVTVQTVGLPSGSPFPSGVNTLTFVVTDASGLTATCSFTITVTDVEDPTITCPGNVTVNADPGVCTATATWAAPTTGDNCGVASVIGSHASGSTFPLGPTTVSYTVTDTSGNDVSCSFTVTVVDTQPPILTCPSDITVGNDAGLCGAVVNYSVTATDNCTLALTPTLTGGLASGSFFPVGTTPVSFNVSDGNGNSAGCTFNVIVDDTQAPTLSCPSSFTVPNDVGLCSAVVTYSVSASDNCPGVGAPSLVTGPASGSSFPTGPTIVTYSVTDAAGNSATCSFTVTVTELELPQITCPTNINVGNDPGLCSAVVTYSTPVGTDNCPGAVTTMIAGLASGAAFPIGTTPVTYSVTDTSGNTASCTFTVTVNDSELPTIVCPGNITVANDPTLCGATVAYATPVGADNCPGAATLQTAGLPSGAFFPVGTTVVSFSVTAANMATASCSFSVTVLDSEDPVLVCPGDLTLEILDPRDPYATGIATATDNCTGSPTVTYDDDRTGMNGCNTMGVILRTWTATDAALNSVSCVQTLTIQDTTDPLVSSSPNITGSSDLGLCSSIETFAEPAAIDVGHIESFEPAAYQPGSTLPLGPSTSWNHYSSTITRVPTGFNGVASEVGNAHAIIDSTMLPPTPFNYSGAFTRLGGYSTAFGNGYTTSLAVYLDMNDPAVTATTYGWDLSSAISNSAGSHRRDFIFHTAAYSAGQITIATSNGSNFTRRNDLLTVTPNTTVSTTGWYTFEWVFRDDGAGFLACDMNVRDSLGSLVFTTTLSHTTGLDPDLISIMGGNRYMWFTFLEVDEIAIDDTRMVRNLDPTCAAPSGTAFPVGTTTVTCSATDACGNVGSNSFAVTITDDENPGIVCPTDITVSNDVGVCGAAVTYAVTATDNCTGVGTPTLTAGLASGSVFPIGTTPVTYTVVDASSNTSTCSFNVTVNDTQFPSITCPPNISVANDPGVCGAAVTYVAPVGTDNCPGATTVLLSGLLSGSTFPIGTSTVTYQVTDASANVATCSFTVSVADTELPTISCPSNITTSTDPGLCSAVVNFIEPVGADNCAGATTVRTAGLAPGSAFPKGTTTQTYVVTDNVGNSATCSFTVTVNDAENPTIACPSDITLPNTFGLCGRVVTYSTPVGADNCIGSTTTQTAGLASGAFFPVGVTTQTFLVTDASGNTATCSFTVTIDDTQDPALTGCSANISVNAASGDCAAIVTFPTPTFSDNCPGSTLVQTTGLASGSSFPVGVTTVTYVVTDAVGNQSTCFWTVTVVDTQAPIVTCPAPVTVNVDAGLCTAAVALAPATATDNCSVTSLSGPVPAGPYAVGTTTVTYTALDAAGNPGTCSTTVTVVDNLPPVLTVPSVPVFVLTPTSPIVVTFSVTATDNCPVTVTCVPPSGSLFPAGLTTVTCSATDGTNTVNSFFDVYVCDNDPAPPVTHVDDDWVGLPNGTNVGLGVIGCDAFAAVQDGITAVAVGGLVNVYAGTYDEDVNIAKTLHLAGTGNPVIRGALGGASASLQVIGASNVEIDGFTITRTGNTFATWNDPNLNNNGLLASSSPNLHFHDNLVTENRNGINLQFMNGANLHNNVVTNNRTGMQLVDNCTNCSVTENFITDNWTMGVLFRDETPGGSDTTGTVFLNNDISGNWYGQIEYRNPDLDPVTAKNFSGNWLGTVTPVIVATSGGEPGYSAQVPVAYGGTAVPPGGQPDVKGDASANFDITPMLESGTDTSANFGFQGDFTTLTVTDELTQVGATNRVQEGIDLVTASTVHVLAGTYTGLVNVNKKVKIIGAGNGSNPLVDTILTVASGDVMTFTASGAGAGDRIEVEALRVLGTGGNGLVFDAVSSFVTLRNLVATGCNYGVGVRNAGDVTDLLVDGCSLDGNTIGFSVATTGMVDGLTVTNGTMSNNSYGIYTAFDPAVTDNENGFRNATFTGTAFSNNSAKGLYFEKLDGSSFTNVTVTSCGIGGSFPSGFDINLKRGNYAAATITNLVMTGSGLPNGNGLAVKTRNDGVNTPTTFAGVHLSGGSVSGSPTGLSLAANARVEGMVLTGNLGAAVVTYTEGLPYPAIDLGNCAGLDVSGLGASTGGNDLSGYGADNAPPFALGNGIPAAGPVVYAQQNTYGLVSPQNIEDLIFDDTDNPAFSQALASDGLVLTMTCPSDLMFQCASSVPSAAGDYASLLAAGGWVSDNGVTVTSVDTTAFTTPSNFVISRVYTVSGACGSTTCTQTISVNDTIAPVPDAGSLPTITGECSATVSGTPTATDNCSGSIVGTTTDPLFYNTEGTYIVTWSFNDGNGNVSTQAQTVIVDDITAPVPDVGSLPLLTGECSVTATAPTATDNCVGPVTATPLGPTTFNTQGSFSITWTYVDGNGNTTTQIQSVTVDDITAPVPDVGSLPNLTGECSVTATAPTATDNCVGLVTATTLDPTVYSSQGTFFINWSYDDGNGNVSTQTQTVIVDDVTAPTPDTAVLPTVTGECSASVTAPTATDNCVGPVTATTMDPTSYSAQGTYLVTWTYDDGNGNTVSQTQTVVVDDITPPTYSGCPSNISITLGTGECTTVVNYTDPTANDNCAGVTSVMTSGLASGSFFEVGVTVVTFTATDIGGNTTLCSFTVTILGDFLSVEDYTTGDAPEELVITDLGDGSAPNAYLADGNLDIVTADSGSDTLTVRFNDGAGDFDVLPALTIFLASGDAPSAVVAGNFVLGGGTDLAVACKGTNLVKVFENTGTAFNLFASLALGGLQSPTALAAGDLDASGLDDVAVACEGTVLGVGSGLASILDVGVVTALAAPGAAFRRPQDVAIGDLNGDGALDLAAVEANSSTPSTSENVLLYEGDGAGTLTPVGSTDHLSTPAGAENPVAIAIGDLDADGLANDIVIASDPNPLSAVDGQVTVYSNDDVPGLLDDGHFTVSVPQTAGKNVSDIAACDLQRDSIIPQLYGGMDAVVTNRGSVNAADITTFHAFDYGTFQFTDVSDGCDFANQPVAVATGDLNNDTLDDVVVVSRGGDYVSVLLSNIRALATPFGTGCNGVSGVPVAAGLSLAVHGQNATVDLSNAAPSSAVVLGVSLTVTQTQLLPSSCIVYLASPILTFNLATDGLGTADFTFAVPPAPSFTGFDLYFQWAVFDAAGDYLGILAFSNGLHVRIGF